MHRISNIYYVIKLFHVSCIFCAHHQELSTVRTAVSTFHAGYVTTSQQRQVGKEFCRLYVQVTLHRDKLRIKDQLDASNIQHLLRHKTLTFFGYLLCPSSGVIYCTHGNCYVSCRLCDHFLAETGWNGVPTCLCQEVVTQPA